MTKLILLFIFAKLSMASDAASNLSCPEGTKHQKRTVKAGTVEECISTSTGETEGLRLEFDEKKVLRRSWNFKNGVPDGEFKAFDEKKNLIRQGTFANGRLTGKMTRWYAKDKIQDETNWLDGRPHGVVKRFSNKGKTLEEGSYQTGRRIGIWKFNKSDGAALPNRNYGEGLKEEVQLQDYTVEISVNAGDESVLTWAKNADVELRTIEEKSQLSARVDVEAKSPGWTLQNNNRNFEPWDQDGRKFTIDLQFTGAESVAEVLALGPNGLRLTYKILIKAPTRPIAESPMLLTEKKMKAFWVGIGLAQRDYSEGQDVSVTSTDAQLHVRFSKQVISPNFELQSNLKYQFASLARTADYSATNFVDLDGAVGYRLTPLLEKWQLIVNGGLFYRTTVLGDGSYGYKNLSGPEVYPQLLYHLDESQSVFASFHYSPIFTPAMELEPGTDIETSLSVGWSRRTASGGDIRLSVHTLQLLIGSTNAELASKTSGLSLVYGF